MSIGGACGAFKRSGGHILVPMSEAIVFSAPIPLAKMEEIAAALAPLVEAGYAVAVVVPDDAVDQFGWRVVCDAPDRHASFRMPANAKPADWAEAISLILRQSL
jgi:hypothetical protein